MRTNRYLLHPLFLGTLLVLLLNDHYLKWVYGNFVTGKLSDIAGLILLPLLLLSFWPKRLLGVIMTSALFFIWWKSPLSQSSIDWYNSWAFIPITRVVDYTDYLALLVLWPLFHWVRRGYHISCERVQFRLSNVIVLSITMLAFSATSPPPEFYYSFSDGNVSFYGAKYRVKGSKTAILTDISTMADAPVYEDVTLRDSLLQERWLQFHLEGQDSVFFIIPKVIFDRDTFRDVQFGLMPRNKNAYFLILNGCNVNSTTDEINGKLIRAYRKALKKALLE